jgi:hypothetical protein
VGGVVSLRDDVRARFADEHPEIFEAVDDERVKVSDKRRNEILDDWAANHISFYLGNLRRERDGLLAASDWTQAADAPVDAKAWAAYRQALRDLPETITDPTADVAWPEPPK